MKKRYLRNSSGFTIVELLVVIVVIGILAAITIVAYSGISQKAIAVALQSDLDNASTQIKIAQAQDDNDNYPSANQCPIPAVGNICLKSSNGNIFTYTPNNSSNPKSFTLDAISTSGVKYRITDDTAPVEIITPIGILAALSTPTIATGSIPQGVAISTDGNSVYAVNNNSSTISMYSRVLVVEH